MHQHYSVMTRSIRGRTCMCVCEVWKLQQENGILSSVYESNRSQVSGCYYCVCYNLLFFWVWWDRIGWFYWALQHAHICILYLYLSLSVCLCKCSYLCVCVFVCPCMCLNIWAWVCLNTFCICTSDQEVTAGWDKYLWCLQMGLCLWEEST